jgi:signal transduction histidine kinase
MHASDSATLLLVCIHGGLRREIARAARRRNMTVFTVASYESLNQLPRSNFRAAILEDTAESQRAIPALDRRNIAAVLIQPLGTSHRAPHQVARRPQDIVTAGLMAASAGKSDEALQVVALGELAAGAAHEINNPLSFLSSNLHTLRHLAREEKLPLDVSEIVDECLIGAQRIADIVKSLGELAQREHTQTEPCDISTAVYRAVKTEVHVKSQLNCALEPHLCADISPLQLDQLLRHVVRNARQATTDQENIHVATWAKGGDVFIQIRDEGEGIRPEHLGRLFEPFFTTRRESRCVGLGLTAAYGIARRASGSITAESAGSGAGACFTIRLPRARLGERPEPTRQYSEAR